jgi:hypothetical protein
MVYAHHYMPDTQNTEAAASTSNILLNLQLL